ncbi:hypothetical protein RHECNPAF_1760038 [Rhizobium etli CNPAF512]|nr:hypothetical protein RHECNPAF_1760038 [Rhizobium etli CNPAF512]
MKAPRPLDLLEGNGPDIGQDILVNILGNLDVRRPVEQQRDFQPHPIFRGVGEV